MFVMTPAIFEEYRHTLSSTFEAQGTTCSFTGRPPGEYCANCQFDIDDDVCYLKLAHQPYREFLATHYPECLV